MNFNKISITAIAVAMFAAGSAFGQNAEIGTWAGFRKGAASFTFDDGAPSHVSDGAPVFDKYGYKATFNLVYNWNPDWSGFQKLANNGHEIASHSNSHGQNMSGEEASSKRNIAGKISGQKYGIITVAYPNCNVPNEGAVLQNYVVGRICNGSCQGQSDIMGKNGPGNWAKASAIMTGSDVKSEVPTTLLVKCKRLFKVVDGFLSLLTVSKVRTTVQLITLQLTLTPSMVLFNGPNKTIRTFGLLQWVMLLCTLRNVMLLRSVLKVVTLTPWNLNSSTVLLTAFPSTTILFPFVSKATGARLKFLKTVLSLILRLKVVTSTLMLFQTLVRLP